MELRKYVDKIEAEQNRLWEDQREHLSEIAQLRERLAEKVEECLLIETECTKLDKQVKSLQPENDIDRIFVEQAEVENIMVDKESQCTLQQSSDDEIKASQLREIASLRSEVQVLAQQLNAREQELQLVSTDLGVVQATIKQKRAQREQVTKVWLDEVSALKKRVLELEQALESSKVFSNDHQVAYQKELRLIKVVNQQLRSELATRENAIQVLEQQHKEDQLKREQQQQTLVQALKARIEQKVADVDRLHALVSEHAAEKISYNAVKRQVEDLEHQVDILMKEKDRWITDNLLLQQEAEAKAQTQHDKLQDVENRRLSKALSVAEQDRQLLQTQLSEVEAELADQILILQRQKRSHAKAMERLFESSLRLCVVAPTVNVQLNTNGAFLKSKGSNLSSAAVNQDKEPTEGMSILCRSSPQHDSIKRVIESDVLPQFTSVFLQGNDDASPQSGVPMARWLQDLLIDMQSRIAAQLEGIYSAAAANDSK
ncbi:unnamed protein product [Phytophthora lilii]|uniref:Unnamed protein product n=1 Tax=Phytophthora lilii TaxID=2077276 RepID=A0A9W6UAN3_9STRA|nr:unnamed protein product [Phytophthora lilii]